MTYAVQLDIAFPAAVDFSSSARSLGDHVYLLADRDFKVRRSWLTRTEKAAALRVLPPAIRQHCRGVGKSKIGAIPPHIHTQETSVINFYHSVGGQETVFYEGECVVDDSQTADNGNAYIIVKPEILKPVMSFIAKPGDVWALNTRKPHAVLGGDNQYREVLQVYMNICVDELLELMRDANTYS